MDFLGILFLVIAVTLVAIISHIRKKYQILHGEGIPAAFSFLFYVCLLSAAFGVLFSILLADGNLTFGGFSFGFAAIYAVCSSVTALIFIIATAWGSLSVLTIVAMLGSLVFPSLYGAIAFPGENRITVVRIAGFIFAFVCMALVFRREPGKKSNRKFIAACIIVFFTQGAALIIFDAECRYCPEVSYFLFVSVYMLISAGIALAAILFLTFRKPSERRRAFLVIVDRKTFFLIGSYGVFFCASEVLCLYSVERLPLIVQAPLTFAIQILIVAAIDYLIYREKLPKIQILQIVLAIASSICFCI